jgi:hypothetical protein
MELVEVSRLEEPEHDIKVRGDNRYYKYCGNYVTVVGDLDCTVSKGMPSEPVVLLD